ncbi:MULTISPECIES: DUF2975 domain-containing protein [Desulfosporosinus]|uniref:DUF2975 domain-containing protein n=1 Tax=Desulfosporosinus acididurans TaxID=476652 RepID=A0A0J1FWM1_9FIRM|nr:MULTISPECIES: DUF2975 domain-containing protein [Desulfosporosinus]KLU67383.1 hypothetical protein DEAC_c05950 [Desulfosporosinus acididurans]
MVILDKNGLSGFTKRILDFIFLGGLGIFVTLPYALRWYMNAIYRTSTENYYFLLGFLYITGLVCLGLVNEMRKIFKTLNRRNPFMMDNVKSLNRVGGSCFIIAAAYLIKIFFYNSVLTAIITMVFIIAGLFAVVLAEVFRQAIAVKEENDLTV